MSGQGQPRLRRALSLWNLIFIGMVIIQPTPNLSVTIPKQGDQKVLVNGIWTLPPADLGAGVTTGQTASSANALRLGVASGDRP